MNIVFNDKQKLLDARAIQKADSRARASFAKFGDNVQAIEIAVVDTNGPRGGIDKECRVHVQLRKLNNVSVTVKDESLSKAISSAIDRAARSVARTLDRRAMQGNGRLSRLNY